MGPSMKKTFKHDGLEYKPQSQFNREAGTARAGQQPAYRAMIQWFVYSNGLYIGAVIVRESATRQQIIEEFKNG